MDTLDDSENNAKVSDSAYSCSNSQSRRSHSSKSTHSGSNFSGSSGYGGQPSTSGSSQPPEKRIRRSKDKETKKKKQEIISPENTEVTELRPPDTTVIVSPKEDVTDVALSPVSIHKSITGNGVEGMDISSTDQDKPKDVYHFENESDSVSPLPSLLSDITNLVTGHTNGTDGFACAISMDDGVVMYTSATLTATLGFPKDMWIGRSFLDFVHPTDRNALATHIANGFAMPKPTDELVQKESESTMFCRIRRYRSLSGGFGVKERAVTHMPFLLKLSFKNINDEEEKVLYLLIEASSFLSAFKVPNEQVLKAVPFILRHNAKGDIEHIDSESVPYLGFLPQELVNKDALQLYHPEDLEYLKEVYETIVKNGSMSRSKPIRIKTQNGDYVKVEVEWSSFINPWPKKLEFVTGKLFVTEGPPNPDVFQTPPAKKPMNIHDEDEIEEESAREHIKRIMSMIVTSPSDLAKNKMSKRCQNLTSFMDSLLEEEPKSFEDLSLEIQDADNAHCERDSVMLGGLSPHHDNNSKSSTETLLSYNQLNYNVNLQRYFDSQMIKPYEDFSTTTLDVPGGSQEIQNVENQSQMERFSGDSNGAVSSCESSLAVANCDNALADFMTMRLTEAILSSHNSEMQKELLKKHRENRSVSRSEKEKVSNETRKKKKEHLARCNVGCIQTELTSEEQPTSLKRHTKHEESETCKQRCTGRRWPMPSTNTATTATVTTAVSTHNWATPNPINSYVPSIGIPQPLPLMSPVATVSGIFPMYYIPAAPHLPMHGTQNIGAAVSSSHYASSAVQYMMYGEAVFGSPFVLSPINPHVSSPPQRPYYQMPGNFNQSCRMNPNSMQNNNFTTSRHNTKSSSVSGPSVAMYSKTRNSSNDEPMATDGESSYSSFYSSFFKTESGSADDSSDNKHRYSGKNTNLFRTAKKNMKKSNPHKAKPSWMDQVCVTSDLIYKYQVLSKSLNETLVLDKERMEALEQPSLVNEQLGQLYLDLHLEGVAAKLTLEEGITSSGSSGEETVNPTIQKRNPRRKREYSKLTMIYEEDAPLPSPETLECFK